MADETTSSPEQIQQPLWPAAHGQGASFKFQHIQPPAGAYFSLNDKLIVRLYNPGSSNVNVIISGRVLRLDGQIIPFNYDIVALPVLSGVSIYSIQIGEGFLLDVVASAASGQNLIGGSIYITILRTISTGSTELVVGCLLAGYLNPAVPISWPVVVYQRPGSDNTAGSYHTIDQPAAGQELSISTPVWSRWRVQSIIATLTTSAAVANRVVSFTYWTDGKEVFLSTASTAQTASTTQQYIGIAGLGSPYQITVGSVTRNFIPLPVNWVISHPGLFTTITDNLKPGDQWSAGTMQIEHWTVDY